MDGLVVRAGVVQGRVKARSRDDCLAWGVERIAEAGRQGCGLVCLPEAFATSLSLPELKKLAEPIPGPTSEALARAAREAGTHVVAGLVERDGERVYSSALLLDDAGALVDVYRRAHTFSLEARFLARGGPPRVSATRVGRIGLIVGYDINFPEACRLLFRERVEIIACPSQLLAVFRRPVRYMVVARAAENCCYLLYASSAGANTLAGLTYMGHSLIVRNPVGLRPYGLDYQEEQEVLAEAGLEEGLICADLDLGRLRREQESNPHYADALELTYAQRRAS